MMKKCTKCDQEHEQHHSWCRACRRQDDKNRYKAKDKAGFREKQKKWRDSRRSWLNEQKNKPCADCKVQYPPYVMQFDHLGEKEFEISQGVWTNPLSVVVEEIAKCELVCANCHAERTHKRGLDNRRDDIVSSRSSSSRTQVS